MTTLTIGKIPLLEAIKRLKVGKNMRNKKARETLCEITVTDANVKLVVAGITYNVSCITEGVAKFTIPVLYLNDLINCHEGKTVTIHINRMGIKIGEFFVDVPVSLIENDKILKTIDIPLNYTDMDILNLLRMGYTQEELTFNKVNKQIDDAIKRLDENIEKAFKILKPYGLEKEVLKTLAYQAVGLYAQ